jgi:hypothetical protein
MSAKRSGQVRPAGSSGDEAGITNALLVAAALGWGLSLLVQRRQLTWPPLELLSSLSTLAGCLAVAGPLILARSGASASSLGNLIWLTGGLLVWIFDLAAVAEGRSRAIQWAAPLGDRAMGLIILAVMVAGWRSGLAQRDWSWTNVTGWALGLFWVGAGLATWFLKPSSALAGLAAR